MKSGWQEQTSTCIRMLDESTTRILVLYVGLANCSHFSLGSHDTYLTLNVSLGVETAYLTESERQAELVRLRREKRLAERENDFEKAALMIGLAEKQQVEANER